jgi:hypothetical protein
MSIINCLSVKNPWAYAIMHLGKNIENRTRGTTYRGKLYIHASQSIDPVGWKALCDIGNQLGRIYPDLTFFEANDNCGCILGFVELYEISRGGITSNPWGEVDKSHWYLRDPMILKTPIPTKGKLGIWQYEVDEDQLEFYKGEYYGKEKVPSV